MSAVYEASPVKRGRRTHAEPAAVDEAIIEAVELNSPVSLRGVYYRVVSAGAVDKTEAGYDLVARELLKLRRSRRVRYADVTDGTRMVTRLRAYDGVGDALADTARHYRRRLWTDSAVSISIFTEKDAISGVVEPVTLKWDVPYGVMRGFASESFCWTVAQSVLASGVETFMYQLGDHDPSGVAAWDSFARRVREFVAEESPHATGWIHFERLAVTEQQIEAWSLPTRPTKASDSRSKNFDGDSVEVDAIPPDTLRQIVEDAIERHVDAEALRLTQIAEDSEREILRGMARQERNW